MVISVLLPTRNRYGLLRRSVESIRKTASDPDNLEIIIVHDNDDFESYKTADDLGVDLIAGIDRLGYSRLNEYYNLATEMAVGEWSLLWNDDAIMRANGWDQMIRDLDSQYVIADMQGSYSPQLCCFPAVRADAIDAVGGFSPHTPHCDTYWQDIGRSTGRIAEIPAHVLHDRFDITGNNQDLTYRESQAGYRTSDYYSARVQDLIREDMKRIEAL